MSVVVSEYFSKLVKLQNNSYSPYSKFQVAAILVLQNGEEFVGVNVENAAFGSTICAERSAFSAAISNLGFSDYKEMHLLAGQTDDYVMPCGECRQVIRELTDSGFVVHVYNQHGASESYSISALLPQSFSGDSLKGWLGVIGS